MSKLTKAKPKGRKRIPLEKEQEILKALSEGYTAKSIGEEYNVSTQTVYNVRNRNKD